MRPHERDEQPGTTRQPAAATPARDAGAPTPRHSAAAVLALQRSAGNRAVASMLARNGVVAPPPPNPHAVGATSHTPAELRAMPLEEFHAYTETQADWRKDASLVADPAAQTELRALLEFATGGASHRAGADAPPVVRGCGAFLVSDMLANAGAAEQRKLRAYSDAFAQTRHTVEVDRAPDIARAILWGDAIIQLEAAMPLVTLRRIAKQDSTRKDLDHLIDGRSWRGGPGGNQVANFATFVSRARPLLEADNGAEIDAYLGLAATVDPVTYVGTVPHVRNPHHFQAAALDTLKTNWSTGNTGNLPFTLILHSGMDNNGAFHHDPSMTASVSDAHNFALMIEGARTLADVSHLIPTLARTYGVGGKIQQAMIAGHGESRTEELAGGEGGRPGEIRHDDLDLDHNRPATEALFGALLDNMERGPNARLLLNGCLTASHQPLAHLPAGERDAALAIRNQAQSHPAIADRLRDMAHRRGFNDDTINAASASFSADTTLIDPATGKLRLGAPGYDPQLTTTDRLDYVREAGEPEGALRAVLEIWGLADHPAAGGHAALPAVAPSAGGAPVHSMAQLRTAMEARVAAGGGRWEDGVIVTMYQLILRDLSNGALINRLAQVSVIRSLAELHDPNETHVTAVYQVPLDLANDIYTGLSAHPDFAARRELRIVLYHSWAVRTAAKRLELLTELSFFTAQQAREIVDFTALDAWGLTTPLLDPALATTAPAREGQLRLALLEAIRHGTGLDANAKKVLVAERGPGPAWANALHVRTALGGASTEGRILDAIRDPDPDPGVAGGGGGGHDFNVDLDRDGTNDIYVEPMPRRGAVSASVLNVRQRPGMEFAVVADIPRATEVILIGKVGPWYAIEHDATTAFVHSSWVRLTPNP